MKPVWIEGDGFIAPDGSWFTEDQLRAGITAVSEFCEWFESLPQTLQDLARWEASL